MLIDVRTQEEYEHSHHDGAVNIPLEEIGTRDLSVPTDEKLILYCQSGGRARVAQMVLAQRGFKNTELLSQTGAY